MGRTSESAAVVILFMAMTMLVKTTMAVKGVYWYYESGISVSDIDSSLFTHIFYAFADLNNTTYKVSVATPSVASSFTSTLREKNPSVETLLSIGGGASEPDDFSSMANGSASRKAFIDSTIDLARSYGFSGLDLDWEYPESDADIPNFTTLLQEWRAAVVDEAKSSGKTALLLTAAVYYSSTRTSWRTGNTVDFPIKSMKKNLDWVNVMDYDFQGPGWRPATTYAPAALYDPLSSVDINTGLAAWINAGMPSCKMALGMPFYGRAWKLVNPTTDFGIGAAADGAASGTGIESGGAILYKNINAFIEDNDAITVYNSTLVTNYCYSGTTWIGYDDVESVKTKVSYAKSNQLLGYFAWQIAGDDDFALSKAASSQWD